MKSGTRYLQLSIVFLSFLFVSAADHAHSQDTVPKSPKLILQITVDQLRGDMPASVYDRLGQGGFRYLYEKGVVYENAYHRHANTETVVGHATLATGADPADHGMVGNIWFDRELGRVVYNIEDDRYTLVGEGGGVDKDVEMDPTQKAAATDGRSPATILSTTFSDELALATNGKAKIYGVSVKDRGAVTMAGHAGKAFWFSKAKGEFVTSTYYYDAYPGWVDEWNRKQLPQTHADTSWELLHERSTYTYGDYDDMDWETDFPGYGVVFPHPFGKSDSKYFTTLLTVSPAGDELTLEFAKELLVKEGLGLDEVPDYLSISFSSTDYVGHISSALPAWKVRTICCASTRPWRSCSPLSTRRSDLRRPSSCCPRITARPRSRPSSTVLASMPSISNPTSWTRRGPSKPSKPGTASPRS